MWICIGVGIGIKVEIRVTVRTAVDIAELVFFNVVAVMPALVTFLTAVVRFRTLVLTPLVRFEEVTGGIVDLVGMCCILVDIMMVVFDDRPVGVVGSGGFQVYVSISFFIMVSIWIWIFEVEVQ